MSGILSVRSTEDVDIPYVLAYMPYVLSHSVTVFLIIYLKEIVRAMEFIETDAEIITAMREWVMGLCIDDDDVRAVSEWSDNQIGRFVFRNYDGGVAGFILSL